VTQTLQSIRLVRDTIDSPLGEFVAVASDDGLCLLEFHDRRALPTQLAVVEKRHDAAIKAGTNEHLEQAAREIAEYFDGQRTEFDVPLDLPATPFQRTVWDELLRIPFGETRSYSWIAEKIGKPAGVRAVGRANGHNRVAIIVPCHRVIRSDGALCGYGGKLWRKEELLRLEGVGLFGGSA